MRALQPKSLSNGDELAPLRAQTVTHGEDHRTAPLSDVLRRLIDYRFGREKHALGGETEESLIPLGDDGGNLLA